MVLLRTGRRSQLAGNVHVESTIRQEEEALLRASFYGQRRQSPVARLGAAAPAARLGSGLGAAAPAARLGSAHFGASWGNEAADQESKPAAAASAAAAASPFLEEARRRLREEVRLFYSPFSRTFVHFFFLLTRARAHI